MDNYMLHKVFVYCYILGIAFSYPFMASAQSVNLPNPLSVDNILESSSYVGLIIKRVLGVVGALALLLLVYGGISMIIAAGNETKIAKAKSLIAYTAIGLVVIFSSYTIINFVIQALRG